MNGNDDVYEKDFFDLTEFRDSIYRLPLTSFFEETNKGLPNNKLGTWLNVIDEDTLKMIIDYGEKAIFDEATGIILDDEDADLPDEIADYWVFCLFAVGWETGSFIIPKNDFEESFRNIYFLAVAEHLHRKGFCTVEGEMTIENALNIKMTMTPEGKAAMDEEAKELKKKSKPKAKR